MKGAGGAVSSDRGGRVIFDIFLFMAEWVLVIMCVFLWIEQDFFFLQNDVVWHKNICEHNTLFCYFRDGDCDHYTKQSCHGIVCVSPCVVCVSPCECFYARASLGRRGGGGKAWTVYRRLSFK